MEPKIIEQIKKSLSSKHRIIYPFRYFNWVIDPRRFGSIPEYPIDRPIFLLGTQGGGLTLLSRMLRRHQAVISAGGNNDYWSSADEMQNIYGLMLPFEFSGLRYNRPFHPVFTGARSWSYGARELFPLYRKTAQDATPEFKKTLEFAIRYSAVRHAKDKYHFRFLDKSQVNTVRLGFIYELLKEYGPRFVLMTREPYISVYRAATGKAADMLRWRDKIPYEERIDICAEHYGNTMRSALEDREKLGFEMHILRFEDLMNEPENELKKVCEFVELEYNEDMLPKPHHKIPLGTKDINKWYPLRPNVNESYAKDQDRVTLDAVNKHCADVIERLGYVRNG